MILLEGDLQPRINSGGDSVDLQRWKRGTLQMERWHRICRTSDDRKKRAVPGRAAGQSAVYPRLCQGVVEVAESSTLVGLAAQPAIPYAAAGVTAL